MKTAGLDSSGPAFFTKRNVRIGAAALMLALLFIMTPLFPVLCAEEAQTGALKAIFVPVPGQEFYIAFTHSVNRTEVREYYELRDKSIFLTRAEYTSFGAGMPEVPEVSGSTLTVENGVLRLDHINTPMPQFIYRIGTVAAHTLHINGREIPLKTIAPPQTALRFQYRSVSAYAFIRRLNRSE